MGLIVASLDGDARAFYQREFHFFDEVTSISGKLKPFIKKDKPEKKACNGTKTSFLMLINGVGENRRGDGQDYCGSWRLPPLQSGRRSGGCRQTFGATSSESCQGLVAPLELTVV